MTTDRDGEPSLDPTPRRLEQARRGGDVPVSPALNAWGACVAGGIALAATGGASLASMAAFSRDVWTAPEREPYRLLASATAAVARVVAPVLVAAALGALLLGLVQTRGLFAWSFRRAPSLAIRGWPPLRALSVAMGAALAVGFALRGTLHAVFDGFGATPGRLADRFTAAAFAWLGPLFAVVTAFVALDAIAARVAWRRRLRMTAREVRQEQREEEGDPLVARRRRDLHEETILPDEPPP